MVGSNIKKDFPGVLDLLHSDWTLDWAFSAGSGIVTKELLGLKVSEKPYYNYNYRRTQQVGVTAEFFPSDTYEIDPYDYFYTLKGDPRIQLITWFTANGSTSFERNDAMYFLRKNTADSINFKIWLARNWDFLTNGYEIHAKVTNALSLPVTINGATRWVTFGFADSTEQNEAGNGGG